MPKGLDLDKIVAETLRRLAQSGMIDDVKSVGGNLADDISKILSEATGKTPKPVKPPKAPKVPKSPPKSGRGKNPPAAGAIAPAPKGPKPKGPKSGTADKAERDAQKEIIRQQNRDNWAKEREAYNEMKAIEREQRKAENRAAWAKKREEEYGGNITEAVKGTSRGRNRNKKKDAK